MREEGFQEHPKHLDIIYGCFHPFSLTLYFLHKLDQLLLSSLIEIPLRFNGTYLKVSIPDFLRSNSCMVTALVGSFMIQKYQIKYIVSVAPISY